ncbi:MAG: EamA family transporter [Planctomycetota bacterium]
MATDFWVGIGCAAGSSLLAGISPLIFKKQGPETDRQQALWFWSSLFTLPIVVSIFAFQGFPFGSLSFLSISVISTIFGSINGFAYFSIVAHRGPVSISWPVVYSSCVIVAVLAYIFLKEQTNALQIGGLGSLVVALALFGYVSRQREYNSHSATPIAKGYWLWLFVSLGMGGLAGFGYKLKNQYEPVGSDMILIGLSSGIMMLLPWFSERRAGRAMMTDRQTMTLSLMLLIPRLGAMWLMLAALRFTDAAVVFPFQAGCAILVGVIIAVIRGEPASWLWATGVALVIASVVMITLN